MSRATGSPIGAGPASRAPRLELWALVVSVVLLAAYSIWTPQTPDLAAQVARADVVRAAGAVTWWTGWFGGLSLPTYSVMVPWLMAVLGVTFTGVLAAVGGAIACRILVRDTAHPRAGTIACAVALAADVLAGRVTFAVGLALACWALVALRAGRMWICAVLAVLSLLASPLAGLFLGLPLLAVAISDPTRRRAAAVSAGALLLGGGVMAVLYPGTGVMPFPLRDVLAPAGCCALVLWSRPPRVVRVSTVLVLIALPVFYLVPGAVGSNIARFAWVCAVPVLIACGRRPRAWLALAAVAAAIWPVVDLTTQLQASGTKASHAAFYAPLITELRQEQAASATAVGGRVEVIDTRGHWASAYVASALPLARGWDRQADNADNPIFYQQGALTPSSYRQWLSLLAVHWVALPNAPLDAASVQEARLVRSGLGYLTETWQSADWRLYRVVNPAPLATGAQTIGVSPSSITLRRDTPGLVILRVRYSAYLDVIDATTRAPLPACISEVGGWTLIDLPQPATFIVTDPFDAEAQLDPAARQCTAHSQGG